MVYISYIVQYRPAETLIEMQLKEATSIFMYLSQTCVQTPNSLQAIKK